MNNIFLSHNDPLLSNSNGYKMFEQQVNPQILYQQMYANSQKDWISELDEVSKNIDVDVANELANNKEYIELSNNLPASIQSELMSIVKGNLNMNPTIVNNIKRQIDLINNAKDNRDAVNRQNLNELNDYMKNYSHLTFDEYKKVKEGKPLPKQKKTNNENKQ